MGCSRGSHSEKQVLLVESKQDANSFYIDGSTVQMPGSFQRHKGSDKGGQVGRPAVLQRLGRVNVQENGPLNRQRP